MQIPWYRQRVYRRLAEFKDSHDRPYDIQDVEDMFNGILEELADEDFFVKMDNTEFFIRYLDLTDYEDSGRIQYSTY